MRIAAPLAGEVVNCKVVALAKKYAFVSTPLMLALTSVSSRYGNVKEKVVVEPSPVNVFSVVAITPVS